MPRGYPDWGVKSDQFGQYESDVNELAAKLGFPGVFSRSGKTVFFHKFEDGFGSFQLFDTSLANGISIIDNKMLNGEGCLEIFTGSSNGQGNSISGRLPGKTSGNVGIEVIHAYQNDNAPNVLIGGGGVSEGNFRNFSVRLDLLNDTVEIRLPDLSFHVVEIYPYLIRGYPNYYSVKLVFNIQTGYYHYVTINDVFIDLSSYQGSSTLGVSQTNYITMSVNTIKPTTQPNSALYVDSIIVTVDEP